MINIVVFPNDTHFLLPLRDICCATLLTEIITYPFDRIA